MAGQSDPRYNQIMDTPPASTKPAAKRRKKKPGPPMQTQDAKPAEKPKKQLLAPRDEAFHTARLRIQPFVNAVAMWERVLTDEDRKDLGGDLGAALEKYRGTAGMWMHVRGVSFPRAVIDVAVSLNLMDEQTHRWLLRELNEKTEPLDVVVAAAVKAGKLVVTERPRQVFWDGSLIEFAWGKHDVPWKYIWELCRLAMTGQSLDRKAFGDVEINYLAKLKSRLTCAEGFPSTLAEMIVPDGPGTQKLTLPKERIKIFVTAEARLCEWRRNRADGVW
jgi:hypothetical protein